MLITDSVRDVAFSPNLGRSYHMLAVASKDVRIMTLKPIGSRSEWQFLGQFGRNIGAKTRLCFRKQMKKIPLKMYHKHLGFQCLICQNSLGTRLKTRGTFLNTMGESLAQKVVKSNSVVNEVLQRRTIGEALTKTEVLFSTENG